MRKAGGSSEAIDPEVWLDACRRIVDGQREVFAQTPGIASRTEYEGIGEGGDRTLVIDRRCEDVAIAELARLHDDGHEFGVITEERGEVAFGDPDAPLRVVVDPIDGSLNARRTIPAYSVSIAIASGMTMADVEVGFVHDFGAHEEFSAVRGQGARLGDDALEPERPYGEGLEVVAVESADPAVIAPVVDGLRGRAFRIRAPGSIAISLVYVAAGRFDGMLSARSCRSVDAAAAQLIAREAGGLVAFGGDERLETAALDLSARYEVAAALDRPGFEALLEVQRDTIA